MNFFESDSILAIYIKNCLKNIYLNLMNDMKITLSTIRLIRYNTQTIFYEVEISSSNYGPVDQ